MSVWRTPGLEGVKSTSRIVQAALKDGVALESLPHEVRLEGGVALVVVLERTPLCLSCMRTGRVLKDCRIPRCNEGRRFGHVTLECVRTYATMANRTKGENITADHRVDEHEAQAAADVLQLLSALLPTDIPREDLQLSAPLLISTVGHQHGAPNNIDDRMADMGKDAKTPQSSEIEESLPELAPGKTMRNTSR